MTLLAGVLQGGRLSSSLAHALFLDSHSHGSRCAGLLRRSTKIGFPSLLTTKALRVRGKASAAQQTRDATHWDDAADAYFSRTAAGDADLIASPHPHHHHHPQPRVSSTEEKQDFHGRTRNAGAFHREDQSLKDSEREERLRVRVRAWRGLNPRDGNGTPRKREPLQREPSRKESTDWSRSYRNRVAPPRASALNKFEGNGRKYGDDYDDEEQNGGSRHKWGRRDFKDQKVEPSEVPKLKGEAIYGVGPIRAALHACRRDLYTLYTQEGLDLNTSTKRKGKEDLSCIFDKAKGVKLGIVPTSKHVLNMLVDNRPHQGLVLDASPLELVATHKLDPPECGDGRSPVWVALDEVIDPQNLGAILRSAYYFGAKGVVICMKNSAPLSGVVSKASAGALEVMELWFCRNMVNFLQSSIENGWRVVGSCTTHGSTPLHEIRHDVPTILVLGNEGVGLRTNVQRACTDITHIPGMFPLRNSGDKRLSPLPFDTFLGPSSYEGPPGGAEVSCLLGPPMVDSLNVSVAAGILLHQLMLPEA